MPSNHDIAARLTAIAAALRVPAGYPAEGRAWPSANVVKLARRAGWPLEQITAVVPGATSAGREAVLPITVAPREWVEELARRLGCDLADVCRGLIPDE